MKLSDEVAKAFKEAHEGHLIAYVPSMMEAPGLWRLSIVRDETEGHYPISEDYFMGSRAAAQAEADRLNRDLLKLPVRSVLDIVASSMRGSRRKG